MNNSLYFQCISSYPHDFSSRVKFPKAFNSNPFWNIETPSKHALNLDEPAHVSENRVRTSQCSYSPFHSFFTFQHSPTEHSKQINQFSNCISQNFSQLSYTRNINDKDEVSPKMLQSTVVISKKNSKASQQGSNFFLMKNCFKKILVASFMLRNLIYFKL